MDHVVLRIYVSITDVFETNCSDGMVKMLLFDGYCDCEQFQGKILPGAVDTQRIRQDGTVTLSARYMLEGTDREGQICHIFIENNANVGVGENTITKPDISTDSPDLKWLETAELYGELVTEDGQLVILIKESK